MPAVSLAVMKLDILDTFDEIKIAVDYKIDGKSLPSFPGQLTKIAVMVCTILILSIAADQCILKNVDVEYVTFPGWKQSTEQCSTFDELPVNAQAYVKKIEDYLGVQSL